MNTKIDPPAWYYNIASMQRHQTTQAYIARAHKTQSLIDQHISLPKAVGCLSEPRHLAGSFCTLSVLKI